MALSFVYIDIKVLALLSHLIRVDVIQVITVGVVQVTSQGVLRCLARNKAFLTRRIGEHKYIQVLHGT